MLAHILLVVLGWQDSDLIPSSLSDDGVETIQELSTMSESEIDAFTLTQLRCNPPVMTGMKFSTKILKSFGGEIVKCTKA